jgi:hypothetical protein
MTYRELKAELDTLFADVEPDSLDNQVPDEDKMLMLDRIINS